MEASEHSATSSNEGGTLTSEAIETSMDTMASASKQIPQLEKEPISKHGGSVIPEKETSGWGGLSWRGLMATVKKQTEVVAQVYRQDLSDLANTLTIEGKSTYDIVSSSVRETIQHLSDDLIVKEGAVRQNESARQNISAADGVSVLDGVISQPISGEQHTNMEQDDDDNAKEARRSYNESTQENFVETAAAAINRTVQTTDEYLDKAEAALGDALDLVGGGLKGLLAQAVHIVESAAGKEDAAVSKSDASLASKLNIIYDRKQALVEALRGNPATFLKDPANSKAGSDEKAAENFKSFIDGWNWEVYESKSLHELQESKSLRTQYENLVPSQVTKQDFWQRYFYTIDELERLEETRKRVMDINTTDEADNDFAWSDDEGDDEKRPNEITRSSHPNKIKSESTALEMPESGSQIASATSKQSSEEAATNETGLNAQELDAVASRSESPSAQDTAKSIFPHPALENNAESGSSFEMVKSDDATDMITSPSVSSISAAPSPAPGPKHMTLSPSQTASEAPIQITTNDAAHPPSGLTGKDAATANRPANSRTAAKSDATRLSEESPVNEINSDWGDWE